MKQSHVVKAQSWTPLPVCFSSSLLHSCRRRKEAFCQTLLWLLQPPAASVHVSRFVLRGEDWKQCSPTRACKRARGSQEVVIKGMSGWRQRGKEVEGWWNRKKKELLTGLFFSAVFVFSLYRPSHRSPRATLKEVICLFSPALFQPHTPSVPRGSSTRGRESSFDAVTRAKRVNSSYFQTLFKTVITSNKSICDEF